MTTPTRTRPLRARILRLVRDVTARLVAAWDILARAQQALVRALARVRPGRAGATATRTAVGVFNRALAAFDRAVAGFAERWAAQDLPQLYRDAGTRALEDSGFDPDRWRWTEQHQATITGITAVYYSDLMRRLTEAVRRARVFLRAAQDATRSPEGIDPEQLLRDHPLGTVIYAHTHRHPVAAWAQSALAWQAVSTANTAAARTALDDLGAAWVEVRDGSGCGWTSHDDDDLADGTIRTIADALAHPAAHPNCIRTFLPRPDLTPEAAA